MFYKAVTINTMLAGQWSLPPGFQQFVLHAIFQSHIFQALFPFFHLFYLSCAIYSSLVLRLSLFTRPIEEKEKGPGIHCSHMYQSFRKNVSKSFCTLILTTCMSEMVQHVLRIRDDLLTLVLVLTAKWMPNVILFGCLCQCSQATSKSCLKFELSKPTISKYEI